MKIHIREATEDGKHLQPRCHTAHQLPNQHSSMLGMYSPTLDEVYCRAIHGSKFKVEEGKVCKNCLKAIRCDKHGDLAAFKSWEKKGKPKKLTPQMLRDM